MQLKHVGESLDTKKIEEIIFGEIQILDDIELSQIFEYLLGITDYSIKYKFVENHFENFLRKIILYFQNKKGNNIHGKIRQLMKNIAHDTGNKTGGMYNAIESLLYHPSSNAIKFFNENKGKVDFIYDLNNPESTPFFVNIIDHVFYTYLGYLYFIVNSENPLELSGKIDLKYLINVATDFLRKVQFIKELSDIIFNNDEIDRTISRQAEIKFPDNLDGENIEVNPVLYILIYNIIKNAFTLLMRKKENTQTDLDMLSKIGGKIVVDVKLLSDENNTYVIIKDNLLSGFALEQIKLWIKENGKDGKNKLVNIGISPEYAEIITNWVAGDFTLDGKVREGMDETIMVKGFSTNGSTGIGLSLSSDLREQGICQTLAFEQGNGGAFFILVIPKKEGTILPTYGEAKSEIGGKVQKILLVGSIAGQNDLSI